MSQKMHVFPSHINFYNYVHQFLPKLNVRESVSRSRYSFKYDGKVIGCANLVAELSLMNKYLEEELFLLRISRSVGKLRYKIFVDENVETKLLSDLPTVEVVENVKTHKEEEIPVQEVKEEKELADPTKVEVGVVDKKEPDWEWVENLPDNKEGKLNLDQYVEKEFGIKLKRNMTMKNMLLTFKEELGNL